MLKKTTLAKSGCDGGLLGCGKKKRKSRAVSALLLLAIDRRALLPNFRYGRKGIRSRRTIRIRGTEAKKHSQKKDSRHARRLTLARLRHQQKGACVSWIGWGPMAGPEEKGSLGTGKRKKKERNEKKREERRCGDAEPKEKKIHRAFKKERNILSMKHRKNEKGKKNKSKQGGGRTRKGRGCPTKPGEGKNPKRADTPVSKIGPNKTLPRNIRGLAIK